MTMSYDKCIHCDFVKKSNIVNNNGVKLICHVTGESIMIKECPMDKI